MLGFGPYVGYGIGGKVKTTGGSVDLKTDVKFQNVVEIGDDPTVSYFKALDAGAIFLPVMKWHPEYLFSWRLNLV